MSWVAEACPKVGVSWMWSPTGENLSYFCLGATSLLVSETFEFKNFETRLPATYNNGRVVKYYFFELRLLIRYLDYLEFL